MMQITPQHHLFVHVAPIDFRKGIDALVGVCRTKLRHNPFAGAIFAFRWMMTLLFMNMRY